MPVVAIDHIEIIVRDVDEYVAFLQKLGFRLLRRTSHHGGSAELQLPGPNQPVIEVHKVGGEENIGINHIAFRVANAQEAYRELSAKGITFEEPPRFIEATGRTIVNFRDPDGWRLQLVDAERKLT
ncbi:MAG: VOC family protein [Dehalococcoidia bacterium]|nr:VOC family protein [Dehalococcoidia bacterium]MDW8119693.1 VOC family protein [Chloroflexota bacterium]